MLRHHIANGVDVNFDHAEHLYSMLVGSILSLQPEAALLLLESGANPNGTAADSKLSPYEAACRMKLEVVRTKLVALGVQPTNRKFGLDVWSRLVATRG